MSVETRFPHAVREIEHVLIPLSDGTRLAARIWLPSDAEIHPVPAILEYLPYRKRDGTWERDALTHPWFAGHGYAAVRVDIRGTGESEGALHDEYSQQEQDDGLEVIAWIARQSWCSGAVGMMGISWGGFNALQIAARRPPALKAVITICSTDDRYRDDVHFMGGALLTAKLGWALVFQVFMAHPPDPELVGERWRNMWLQRINASPLFLTQWLRHQRRDAYWKHGSVCEDYGAIVCPVFAIGGWTDGYTNAIPRLLANLTAPRLGLIGPWAHRYPHFASPGPRIGFLQEALRWWDHWLKGIDNGVMKEPILRSWLMESVRPAPYHPERPGRWIGERSWPPEAKARQLYLTATGLDETPTDIVPIVVNTLQSVGVASGSWCPFGAGPDDADDQRDDDARSVVFDSPPLETELTILGAPVLDLEVACDRVQANLVVRLCAVHPDGASLRVSYGILNLTHHSSHEDPKPLVPGQRMRVHLQLKDVAFRVPPGHRIRIALSTTYWPMIWPSSEPASVTVFSGTTAVLLLPVGELRSDEPELSFPPVRTAAPAPRTVVQEGRSVREIGRDLITGECFDRSIEEPTITRIDSIGIELGNAVRFEFRIKDDDPLSASAESYRMQSITRGDWRVRTELTTQMRATREAFLVRSTLTCYESEQIACHREWDETIPRDLV
jgi:putative CocE/NonD family hydrolase